MVKDKPVPTGAKGLGGALKSQENVRTDPPAHQPPQQQQHKEPEREKEQPPQQPQPQQHQPVQHAQPAKPQPQPAKPQPQPQQHHQPVQHAQPAKAHVAAVDNSKVVELEAKLKEAQGNSAQLDKKLQSVLEALRKRTVALQEESSKSIPQAEFIEQERSFLFSLIESLDPQAKKQDYHGPISATTGKAALRKMTGEKRLSKNDIELKVCFCFVLCFCFVACCFFFCILLL